ncbi:hypothetical protein ZWY2020_016838 [Hordeum vulgare]|nr:hypothetical protein ZWY2020_016838 [Hordeum vulgare]
MTKGQTSKLESQKKKKKAAAPAQRRQRALPAGWIQGDFLPSTVTADDLLELVEQGMIANKSWRLPAEGETEPAPQEGERVLLLSHVYRGFFLLPHPFFRAEEEEGSQEGSVDSAEYVSDSGETEEETEEEEGEVVRLPPEVIHLEEDDQRGSGPTLALVLEVVPSAAAPTMDAPPTETMPSIEAVPLVAEPTGAGLGMPKESSVVPDFCLDAEAEAADIERSFIPNVPLGDEANRDLLRAHIRLRRVGPFIGRLREVIGRIDKELWPEDDSRREIEGLMTRLEDVPNRVQAWKKSSARCGVDVALSLVRVHCKEARKEKLKAFQVANTKKL